MKTPEELFKEFEGKTDIQKAAHLEKLIGIEVLVSGKICDIRHGSISLKDYTRGLSGESVHISYEGDQLREQLLKYHLGDGVELTAQLTGAYSSTFFLKLLSIRNLNDEREKARRIVGAEQARKAAEAEQARRAAEAEQKKEARNREIKIWALGGMRIGAILGFIVGFFRSCNVQYMSVDIGGWFSTLLLWAGIGAAIGLAVGAVGTVIDSKAQ